MGDWASKQQNQLNLDYYNKQFHSAVRRKERGRIPGLKWSKDKGIHNKAGKCYNELTFAGECYTAAKERRKTGMAFMRRLEGSL